MIGIKFVTKKWSKKFEAWHKIWWILAQQLWISKCRSMWPGVTCMFRHVRVKTKSYKHQVPCNQSIVHQTCLLHFFSCMAATPTPWEMSLALILPTRNMFQLMSKQKLWFWAHESWPLKAAGMGLLTNLCPGMTLLFASGMTNFHGFLATKGVVRK